MFTTLVYSMFFVVLSSILWSQDTFNIPDNVTAVPTLVTLFAVTHFVRMVQLNYELLRYHTSGQCFTDSLSYTIQNRSVQPVNALYILASVVVLVIFDYTQLSLVLASSYLATHVLYRHCQMALNDTPMRNNQC